jgi:peroxiredoxin
VLQAYQEYLGVSYPFLMDPGGEVIGALSEATGFNPGAAPQDWIIGADGDFAYASDQYELDALIGVVEEALAGAP